MSKILPLFFIMMLFTNLACTAKKLIVKNSDTLIEYQVTKRIPLYSAQKKALALDIDHFLNAHKKDAVALVDMLNNLQIDQDKFDYLYSTLSNDYRKIAGEFSFVLSKHMAVLDAKQQKDLFKNLKEEDQKIANKPTEERMNEVTERFNKFFGSITKEQKKIFSDYKDYYAERKIAHLERREELQKKFKEIFASDSSADTRTKLFYESFKTYQENLLTPNKNIEIAKKLIPTFTFAQKETLKKKIEEIKEILNFYIQTEF